LDCREFCYSDERVPRPSYVVPGEGRTVKWVRFGEEWLRLEETESGDDLRGLELQQ
jgi:hypothetical protein